MGWIAFCTIVIAALALLLYLSLKMPGTSYKGALDPLSAEEELIASQLRADVEHLAGTIGERNLTREPGKLEAAAAWIEDELIAAGWYTVERQEYEVSPGRVRNLIVELPGAGASAKEVLILGAHYDSVPGCPAANDNGSGVAALMAIARNFSPDQIGSQTENRRTLRLAFFANEEPPYFQTPLMGSYVYAAACRKRGDQIYGMLSLETMGYFSDQPNSQQFPAPGLSKLYPTTGNYIAFVGSTNSKALIQQVTALFRTTTKFPTEATALPRSLPGIGWSDHWSFEVHGYRALMITDTAPFRYPFYHTAEDTPDKLCYGQLARVTSGLIRVTEELLTP